jgi:hypothetical protein
LHSGKQRDLAAIRETLGGSNSLGETKLRLNELEESFAASAHVAVDFGQRWELALVCEDTSIVSIVNRLGYRTGNGNTWTEKRVQHVRHTNGFPACPPHQRLWITMQRAAAALGVSEMVVRRLIAQKSLPAKQIVKFAPWMIERSHLDLPSVRKEIRRVHEGRRTGWAVSGRQTGLFADSHEV